MPEVRSKMAYKYSYQTFNSTSMARASTVNARISFKKSVEVARQLTGKKVSVAKKFLEDVIKQEQVVEYKRFNTEMPHKKGKGVMAGGYPVNVAKQFLLVLKNCEKNAENLGLGESDELKIISASVRQGTGRYKMSRMSGRKMKSTHVEIIVTQDDKKNKSSTKKSTAKSTTSGGNNK